MITSIELLIESLEKVLPDEVVSNYDFEEKVKEMTKALKEDGNYYLIQRSDFDALGIGDSYVDSVISYIKSNDKHLEPDSFETIISFR